MKINSNYESTFAFSVLMENVQENPEINFVIDVGKIKISFPCKMSEDSTIEVKIPKLNEYNNIFTEDEYPAYLEAIIGESYKKPWECTLEIESPVSIEVQEKEIQAQEMKIEIGDIKETKIETPDIIKDIIEPAIPKSAPEVDLIDLEPKRNIFKEFINKDKRG